MQARSVMRLKNSSNSRSAAEASGPAPFRLPLSCTVTIRNCAPAGLAAGATVNSTASADVPMRGKNQSPRHVLPDCRTPRKISSRRPSKAAECPRRSAAADPVSEVKAWLTKKMVTWASARRTGMGSDSNAADSTEASGVRDPVPALALEKAILVRIITGGRISKVKGSAADARRVVCGLLLVSQTHDGIEIGGAVSRVIAEKQPHAHRNSDAHHHPKRRDAGRYRYQRAHRHGDQRADQDSDDASDSRERDRLQQELRANVGLARAD